jgi:hypothetical protein
MSIFNFFKDRYGRSVADFPTDNGTKTRLVACRSGRLEIARVTGTTTVNREQCRELGEVLIRFADTGKLEEPESDKE